MPDGRPLPAALRRVTDTFTEVSRMMALDLAKDMDRKIAAAYLDYTSPWRPRTRFTLGGLDIPLPTAESVFGVPSKPAEPAPAAPVTFKVGDLVRLKSGGPVMTVTELGSTDDPTKFTYNRVYTTYFEGNVKHQLGSSHDCLVRA